MNRNEIWLKYDKHCAYCGHEIEFKAMQVDHIMGKENFKFYISNNYQIPEFLKHLTIDDLNHNDNLNPSCRKCNNYKSDFDLEGFRRELSLQLERLHKISTLYGRALRYGQIKETPSPIIFYFETLKIITL